MLRRRNRPVKEKIVDPNAGHTPAFKLFFYKFDYVIRAIDCYSVDLINEMGVIATGSKKDDRELAMEACYMSGTVIDMIDKYRNGALIEFNDRTVPGKVSSIILDHLNDWADYIETGMIYREVPYDDLRLLDEFGSFAFYKARSYNPGDVTSTAAKAFSLFGSNFTTTKDKEVTYPEYNSPMDDIDQLLSVYR